MSDSGETASGGLLREGLPGVASDEFDPLALYDQIYPYWRNGPPTPVDPLTEPMPTDPSLGSMDPEATTFPKGFVDISGMSETMPSLADFDFGMHNDALRAHDQLINGGAVANDDQPAYSFAGNGQSFPQRAASAGAPGDDGVSDLVVHRRFGVPAEAGPVPIPNYVPPADGSSGMQELAMKTGDNSGAGVGGNQATGQQAAPTANAFAQSAVPYDQMSPQERSSWQFGSPEASNQADPATAPFASAKPVAPLPPPTAQTTGPVASDPSSPSALNGLLAIANSPLRGGASTGADASPPPLSISSTQGPVAQSGAYTPVDIHDVDPNQMEVVTGGSATPPKSVDATGKLLGVIRSGKSYADENGDGADYNTVNGYQKGKSGIDLSQMTIKQALEYQNAHEDQNGQYPPAIGAYQFKPGTLKIVAKALGLDTATAKMDAATQDALAAQLLKQRHMDDYQSGKISKDQFMQNIAKEWSSLPDDMSGFSFYTKQPDRVPGHETSVSPQVVSDAIDALKN